MTDPKIVTDADTVARLSKKAKAIGKILGDDQVVLIEPTGGAPMIACVGERDNHTRRWVAVAIEGGDVWHYDPDTDTGSPAPKAADAAVPVEPHTGDTDHFAGGGCYCLQKCCNNLRGDCICRWGCTDGSHDH